MPNTNNAKRQIGATLKLLEDAEYGYAVKCLEKL